MIGTIKRLNERGFGFIACDGEKNGSHFFHAKHLMGLRFDGLAEGQRIEFESVQGDKGPEARNVRPAN